MNDLDHARALLTKAKEDLGAICGMVDPTPAAGFFTDAVFGLHAQQSVEKALKAWLSSKGEKYERTHDLTALLERLQMLGEEIGAFREFVDFNAYAVQYRYETLLTDDPIDREAVVGKVRNLIAHVESQIAAGQGESD